ncbi:beta-glucosidase [Monocercomonoides exilis]|uniref:beta-glucosidase n=1 Tax=Monocercomonoides exilis TaxID=2049356 RepID=UPI00355A7B1D|nr:beta-glucosidase [Monocercomonoides exilis]|eukprot:MONOS_2893.1-p1 / transcript=MONOS_2893.1 / gene=MONOS_2893 / organism=Monocercomonoides_exilis_PA203 / gene_product=beta-glucosidase / transcript_product=beta-glucosidase / location=Mono_scaffold00063:33134-35677(-) / protein_length=848 / sequence_SO=supercontig / SO=protein_coding / is_pseudo=false
MIIVFLFLFFKNTCNSSALQGCHNEEVDIDKLLDEMTLDEMIGQLNLVPGNDVVTGPGNLLQVNADVQEGKVGAFLNIVGVSKIKAMQKLAVTQSRMKIPLLFGLDVIHGYRTIFPIPLAMSCTWNTEVIRKVARISAVEATADGVSWNYSPMVDIGRDPRWGRIAEGSGEDPYLGSRIAEAMVESYQDNDDKEGLKGKDTLLACVKHFALYGAAEAGRDYNTVDMSRIKMFNEYFPPYKAAIDAGVQTVMAAFNTVDEVPCHCNKYLLTDVLRQKWGFQGFVVSDYTGIYEMIAHGMGDLQEVGIKSLNSGVDMDMCSKSFVTTLRKSVEEGKVAKEAIRTAAKRVLEAKKKLGLFEDPFKYCDESRYAKDVFTKEHRKFAREVAAESIVLLKNEPISWDNSKWMNSEDNISFEIRDGSSDFHNRKKIDFKSEITYTKKQEELQESTQRPILPLQKEKIRKIAVIGPMADAKLNMGGTWCPTAEQEKMVTLLEGLKSVFNEDGLSIDANSKVAYARGCNIDASEEMEEKYTQFGKILFRDQRPKEVILEEAMKIASDKDVDVIIGAFGESAEMSGECSSRTDISIPQIQRDTIESLLTLKKPMVLVLFAGRPLTLEWESEHLSSILYAWFGGTESGHAICDVLFGVTSPSGKLTMSFPRSVGQIPIYYAHKNTGRPATQPKFAKFTSAYLDSPNDPLFPFGYGLSYTTFEYSEIKLSSHFLLRKAGTNINENGTDVFLNEEEKRNAGTSLTATVTVENKGNITGKEVIQLYIRDLVGSISRPLKELKGFEKIELKPGEKRSISFEISEDTLKFYNSELDYVSEPGKFEIYIGGDSVTVKKELFYLL